MTTIDTIGRTLAAIALTLAASATMLVAAVGPASQPNAGAAITRTIA